MAQRIVKINVEGQSEHLIPVGTPVMAILGRKDKDGHPILGAILNNRLVSLSTPIWGPSKLRPVNDHSHEGIQIYRRSISLVLLQAAYEVAPEGKLKIGQSLGDAYFFEWIDHDSLTPEKLKAIEARMRELIAEDRPFVEERMEIDEACDLFTREGNLERVRLLRTKRDPVANVVSLGSGGVHTLRHNPVAPAAGGLGGFELAVYNGGMILRFPDPSPKKHEIQDMPRLFKVYRDTRKWNEILGCGDVGQFNELCINGGVLEIVKVAEALHEKKIAEIADLIVARKTARLVLIAGPSSSGKTTFSKRLSIQLRVNGVRPVALSLDDYYVDRDRTPCGEDGKPDFEVIDALDLPLLNEHLGLLLKGEKVLTPRYDFGTGKRSPQSKWRPMQLGPTDILVVEGIHGLNERLTSSVPHDQKFRIYVSALTQLAIDNHERIFTSDSRLLRRIVRDRLFRGYSAERTIEMWPSVRRGEQQHIFPFQEQADAIFNSALVYEHAVLKTYAKRFLLEVPTDSPSFTEADRLLRFLSLFVPVFPEEVPQTSILREFIGGSTFHY
jgi:uridine kinase